MNPSNSIQMEYFDIFGLTNWIYDTNLFKAGLWIESTIQIFWKQVYKSFECRRDLQIQNSGFIWIRTCSKYIYVLRICQDSWGFVGFVKTGQIFENWLDLWFTIQNKSLSLDLWSTIWYILKDCNSQFSLIESRSKRLQL